MTKKFLFFFLILCNIPLYSQKNQTIQVSPHNLTLSGFAGMAFSGEFNYGYGGGFSIGYQGFVKQGNLVHGISLRVGIEGYTYGEYFFSSLIRYIFLDSIFGIAQFTYSIGFNVGQVLVLIDVVGIGGGVGGTSFRTGVSNGFITQQSTSSYSLQTKAEVILPFGVTAVVSPGWYVQFSHKIAYLFNRNQTLSNNPLEYFLTIGIGWVIGAKQSRYSGDYSSGVLPPL